MTGVDFIQMEWLSTIDWYQVAFVLMNIVMVAVALGLLIYFLILRPKKFKFKIIVLDSTGSSFKWYVDRGGWVIDRMDGTGDFRLVKDKKARLKHPPNEAAITNSRGVTTWTLLKFGPGPHDYSVIDWSNLDADSIPSVIPLADLDWAKHGIKKAAEKKVMGSFWAENKGTIIFITSMVLALIIVMGVVKMAQEQAVQITQAAAGQTEALNNIAESLEAVAEEVSGERGVVAPPPGG